MYNLAKRRKSECMSVKDLINELEKENPDAEITCCGDNYVYLHVENDQSVVTIDCEDLDEAYDWETEEILDEWWNIPSIEKVEAWMTRERMQELLRETIDKLCQVSLKDKSTILSELGITEEEQKIIYKEN